MAHEWSYTKSSINQTPTQILSPVFGLVFDTGLSVTPLMGHLGCMASHWSVPMMPSTPCSYMKMIHGRNKDVNIAPYLNNDYNNHINDILYGSQNIGTKLR